jgi:hypothetical protein
MLFNHQGPQTHGLLGANLEDETRRAEAREGQFPA